jgi:3-methyladenine DNA glycosylase AlkD
MVNNMITQIRLDLRSHATPERATSNEWFFKTGPGEYGEGDVFLGLTVPDTRKVSKKYVAAPFTVIEQLLDSKYHEERLCGLLILVEQTKKADEKTLRRIYTFYIKHRKRVNNWDLVDLSAHKIVGRYLHEYTQPRDVLYKYAHSKDLWEKRIAVLATFWFISKNDFKDSLAIAEILLHDTHDLIHKAVGWMLREVGRKDIKAEEEFLQKHYKTMPRTMLRYAIEKFPEEKRQHYLKGLI